MGYPPPAYEVGWGLPMGCIPPPSPPSPPLLVPPPFHLLRKWMGGCKGGGGSGGRKGFIIYIDIYIWWNLLRRGGRGGKGVRRAEPFRVFCKFNYWSLNRSNIRESGGPRSGPLQGGGAARPPPLQLIH
nr:hypothetical protein [Morchella crassipes]